MPLTTSKVGILISLPGNARCLLNLLQKCSVSASIIVWDKAVQLAVMPYTACNSSVLNTLNKTVNECCSLQYVYRYKTLNPAVMQGTTKGNEMVKVRLANFEVLIAENTILCHGYIPSCCLDAMHSLRLALASEKEIAKKH